MTTPTPIYNTGLHNCCDFRLYDRNHELIATIPVQTTYREDVERAEQIANEFIIAVNSYEAMREALRKTIIPLMRLGDFIGNEDKGGVSGLGPFNRCDVILQVKQALALAEGKW